MTISEEEKLLNSVVRPYVARQNAVQYLKRKQEERRKTRRDRWLLVAAVLWAVTLCVVAIVI
jgi:hypothetical protein